MSKVSGFQPAAAVGDHVTTSYGFECTFTSQSFYWKCVGILLPSNWTFWSFLCGHEAISRLHGPAMLPFESLGCTKGAVGCWDLVFGTTGIPFQSWNCCFKYIHHIYIHNKHFCQSELYAWYVDPCYMLRWEMLQWTSGRPSYKVLMMVVLMVMWTDFPSASWQDANKTYPNMFVWKHVLHGTTIPMWKTWMIQIWSTLKSWQKDSLETAPHLPGQFDIQLCGAVRRQGCGNLCISRCEVTGSQTGSPLYGWWSRSPKSNGSHYLSRFCVTSLNLFQECYSYFYDWG